MFLTDWVTSVVPKVYNYCYDSAVELVASTLNWTGNIAAIGAGVSMAAADNLDIYLSAGGTVFASADITAVANITSVKYGYGVYESLPISESGHRGGLFTYDAEDFVTSDTLRWAALTLVSTSALLKVGAANLSLRHDFAKHREALQNDHVELAPPSIKEHLWVTAREVNHAFLIALTSDAITAGVLMVGKPKIFPWNFNYPRKSNITLETPDYNGPGKQELIPVNFKLDQLANISIAHIPLTVDERFFLTGLLNVTGGAGVVVDAIHNAQPSLIPSAVMAVLSRESFRFFSGKADEKARERMLESKGEYQSLNNDSSMA